MTCPFGTMDWYCCLAAGHDGPHESHELPPDTSTKPPSVPSLDVEACAGLLAELANNPDFYHLHPRAVASLDNLRHFLLEALPGMGKDGERLDWLTTHSYYGEFYIEQPQRLGHCKAIPATREAIDAARAAQPEETSADA